jgi:hypothetical protein
MAAFFHTNGYFNSFLIHKIIKCPQKVNIFFFIIDSRIFFNKKSLRTFLRRLRRPILYLIVFGKVSFKESRFWEIGSNGIQEAESGDKGARTEAGG